MWKRDALSSAHLLAMRFADDMLGEARVEMQLACDKATEEAAKKHYAWAQKSRSRRCIENTVSLARSMMEEEDQAVFDADPWMLNTPDGIVDLRTGEMKPHSSECMCTMITKVSPDPEMEMPMFEKFLDQLTAGDREYAEYLQMVAGMTAVGKVYEEGLVISHGPGANGKSTFFGVWQQVLGSYATTISAEILMARRTGQEVIGMAEVRGKRLVISSETEEGAKLSVSVMKRLTSRDPISARALYQNPITFIPSHTLVMHTNFLPSLKSLDNGTRRRIAITPFTMSLKPGEVIKDFGDKLLEQEGPAILRWIIEGAMKFYKAGMSIPQPVAVQKATQVYLESEDRFNAFIEDCCVKEDGATIMSSHLYARYSAYAKANGEYVRTNKVFAAELDRRGFERKRVTAGIRVSGLKLSEDASM